MDSATNLLLDVLEQLVTLARKHHSAGSVEWGVARRSLDELKVKLSWPPEPLDTVRRDAKGWPVEPQRTLTLGKNPPPPEQSDWQSKPPDYPPPQPEPEPEPAVPRRSKRS